MGQSQSNANDSDTDLNRQFSFYVNPADYDLVVRNFPLVTAEAKIELLLRCCRHRQSVATVKYLLDNIADIPISTIQNCLYDACDFDAAETIEMLIKRGADVHLSHDGRTVGHVCAIRDHVAAMVNLLENGFVIDTPDRDGNTALHTAAMHHNRGMAQLLLSRGADPLKQNRWGLNFFQLAAPVMGTILTEMYQTGQDCSSRVSKLEKTVDEYQRRFDQLYYAPGMPGAVAAQEHFERTQRENSS